MFRLLCAVVFAWSLGVVAQEQKPADPQRPTFRSGAHYVRVDAYPTRDGKPILGLTANDFELLEDGKPQAIDAIEFIDHPQWTPDGDRRDPNSQRDAFELARDPKYRVFALYLDAWHSSVGAAHRLKVPVRELLNRMMGPRDLFGVLTPAQSPKDLILGQLTLSIEEQLFSHPFWEIRGKYHSEEEVEILAKYGEQEGAYLVALRRLDKVYADLEGLIEMFGSLRDERKNIIFVSDTMPSPGTRFSAIASDPGGRGDPPRIGVGADGKLTMGARHPNEVDSLRTDNERSRLRSIDFDDRFRTILRRARQANVSFYTVRPGGLDMDSSLMRQGTSNLAVLAEQTDGIAVLATNDLRGGFSKIADDLSSHYVIGYYTNNTRWDGQTRRITVKLKPSGQTIRARREYRAPSQGEMAAIQNARASAAAAPTAPSATDRAMSALTRLRPGARVQAYGPVRGAEMQLVAEIAATEIEEGRWKTGAQVDVTLTRADGASSTAAGRIEPGARGATLTIPVGDHAGPWQALVKVRGDEPVPESDTLAIQRDTAKLLGQPIAYRAASAAASAFRPLAIFNFRRTERVRLDFPILGALESHTARLLDRRGNPLPVPIPLTPRDADGRQVLSGLLNLAPLSIGDYVIEVTANGGGASEQQLIAIRVAMAR